MQTRVWCGTNVWSRNVNQGHRTKSMTANKQWYRLSHKHTELWEMKAQFDRSLCVRLKAQNGVECFVSIRCESDQRCVYSQMYLCWALHTSCERRTSLTAGKICSTVKKSARSWEVTFWSENVLVRGMFFIFPLFRRLRAEVSVVSCQTFLVDRGTSSLPCGLFNMTQVTHMFQGTQPKIRSKQDTWRHAQTWVYSGSSSLLCWWAIAIWWELCHIWTLFWHCSQTFMKLQLL